MTATSASRIKTWIFCLCALLLLCSAGLVRLHWQAVNVRRRAEVLEERVSKVKPGVSTFSDIQSLVADYGGDQNYDGPCDKSECHVAIGMYSFPFTHPTLHLKLLRIAGIRPTDYLAAIDILNGVVAKVQFSLFYQDNDGNWLTAHSLALEEFSDGDRCLTPAISQHPDYAVTSGTNEHPYRVQFIYFAISQSGRKHDVRDIEQLRLDCATALKACALRDLMPAAYLQWISDSKWQQERSLLGGTPAQCQRQVASSSKLIPWWGVGVRRNHG